MGELKNEFSWSKSRDAAFQECRRAYFLAHYGSWGGWNSNAPAEVRELYRMKNLSSRPAWMGIVVHEVAERAVRSLRQGEFWPLDTALHETEQRLRTELELSQNDANRKGIRPWWNGKRVKFGGLVEHYYRLPLPDDVFEESIQTALQCVKNFYQSTPFRRLQSLPPEDILSVEDLLHFYVGDVKVWVKLDLAVRGKEGGVVIVDWKTGLSHQADDIALQLGIYGLFGMQLWQLPPDQISGFDVNLRDNATRKHQIDASSLESVSTYIQDSAQAMRALLVDVEQNIATIEQFEMTEDLNTCARCRFRRACGRETLEV